MSITKPESVTDIPTPVLRAMRDLCPKKPGESCTMSTLGKSVTLTSETRARIEAELRRRSAR